MSDVVLDPPALVRAIADACHDAGGRVLLVGGCVRDHLMGQTLHDWDLEVFGLTTARLEEVLRDVGRVDAVGRAFAVFKLHERGVEVDVSIPRRDSNAGPGHRGILAEADPTLSPVQASRRRDLTINAMMVDLHTGELLDPHGGRDDLGAGMLRAVDADTFLEDPLRALRVVQFAARLCFDAHPALLELCREAALDELPAERVLGEWAKLLVKGRRPSVGLDIARRTTILDRVFPEHPHPATTDEALDRAVPRRDDLDGPGPKLALMVAVWLHGAPEDARTACLDRLQLHRWHSHPVRDAALAAAAHALDPVDTDASLRWLSTRVEVDLALRTRDALVAPDDTLDRLARAAALGVLYAAPDRWVQGRDLLALGLSPGPRIGDLVQQAYAAQLDGLVESLDEALARIRATVGEA